MSTTTERDQQARHLVELYAERILRSREVAALEHPAAEDYDAVISVGNELDAECEAFRRRHYPRRHRVGVGLYAVFTASRTGRNVETVLDLSEEYYAGAA